MGKRKMLKQLEIPFPIPSADDLARENRIRNTRILQKILNDFPAPVGKKFKGWLHIKLSEKRKSTK
jgi:hypothetical protein